MKKITQLLFILLFVPCLQANLSAQIYVNHEAGGNNDGTSWANAFTDLQPALDAAALGEEVWVTAAEYLPTESPDGISVDPRDKAFHFNTNIKLYGGFNGNETSIDQRNPNIKTTLSGDLGTLNDITDNAYHVLITTGLDSTALIDAFIIQDGNANVLSFPGVTYDNKVFFKHFGSGMFNIESSPTITNTAFTNNTANLGGGISNDNSSPTIINTTFTNNFAEYSGGGMYNDESSPTIVNTTFTNNIASNGAGGGGMYNDDSSPTLTNTTFNNNKAPANFGGGMYNYNSDAILTNTIFTNNTANFGGGISNDGGSISTITNTIFVKNEATIYGGGIYNKQSSDLILTNTNFVENKADQGGGIRTEFANVTVTNSIFKNNDGGGIATFNNYSLTGSKNASDDNGVPGTDIDLSVVNPQFTDENNEDYTLQNNSPLIGAGSNSANNTTLDLAGNPRIINCTIDIGAYENNDNIIVDNTKPTITTVDTQTVNTEGNSCNAVLGDYTSFVTVTDNCDTSPKVAQSPVIGASISGITLVTLTVTDASDNSATTTFNIVVKDATAPIITTVDTQTVNTEENSCNAVLGDYTSFVTVADNCDASPTVTQSPAIGASISGITLVTLTVTDASDNSATTTFNVVVEDATAPTITTVDTQTVNTEENSCNAVLADYRNIAIVADNCDASPTVTQIPVAGASISGITEITLTVTDASNNSTQTTFNVVVEDATAPTIAAVDTQTVNADDDSCSSTVLADYRNIAIVADNCDASPTVTQSPVVGATISETTLVTLTATDASGNSSQTTFNVIVKETIKPTITLVDDQIVNAGEDSCNAVLADYRNIPTVADNCDANPIVTQFPVAGTSISETTLITLTVTDASGNFAETTFSVIVKDATAPTITTVDTQTVNTEENSCNAVLADYRNIAAVADNCDVSPIVTQNPAVGTSISGTTLITLTVTDNFNNSTQTTFNVVVEDATAPVPDAVSLETINANCEVTSLPTPSATDNCSENVTATNNIILPITEEGSTTIIWTFTDESGNITTQNQEVIINSLDVDVTKNGDILIANTQEDVTYQWIDCSNNAPINGETSDSFKVTATGTYALEITTNEGCVFTSTCQDVDVITLNTEEITVNNFTLYPNPSQDIFNISFTTPLNNVDITVSSVTGSVILSKKYSNTNNIQLNLENEAAGIYFLRVITPLGDKTIKLVKI